MLRHIMKIKKKLKLINKRIYTEILNHENYYIFKVKQFFSLIFL